LRTLHPGVEDDALGVNQRSVHVEEGGVKVHVVLMPDVKLTGVQQRAATGPE
jgi:hypothetical protein